MFAVIMLHVNEFKTGKSFETESEADEFALFHSRYESENGYLEYDPPIALLFEIENESAWDTGKFTRPVAVYQRGQRFTCSIDEPIIPPR